MHLLQEGVRLCWTLACTGDTVGKEVLVQSCRAHKLRPDASWLSLRDEQVSWDKTLQQVNGMMCCLVFTCFLVRSHKLASPVVWRFSKASFKPYLVL